MSDTKKLLELAKDGTQVNVIDAYRDELPELHFDDEEEAVQKPKKTESEPENEIPYITSGQIATFLKATYMAHGFVTREMEIWTASEEFFRDVANGITDHINAWAENVPAIAYTIQAVDAAGSWGSLIFDYSMRWYSTLMEKKRKKEEAANEEGERLENGYLAR